MTFWMKSYFCIGVALLFLSGCSVIKTISVLSGGEPNGQNQAESTLDFDLRGHMILVKVRLNDAPKEYTFIVDTGAFNAVREDVARDIALENVVELDAMGTGGGSQKISLVRLAKLNAGGMEVRECGAGVFDFSLIEQMSGIRLDGILGSNFLRHFRVTIDYRNRKITLFRPGSSLAVSPEGYRLKFEQAKFSGFAPVIEHVAVGNTFLDALIDTGARESIISLDALNRLNSTDSPAIQGIGATGGGAFKLSEHNQLFRINSINFGSLVTRHLPVMAVEQHKEYLDKILLGKNFLERYLVTIDYPANELTLEPVASDSATTNFYSVGLLLKHDNDGALNVMGLWRGSPADQAGLMPGDRIERVNGRRANTVPLAEINDMLRDDRVNRIELGVRHGKEERNIILYKKFLFPEIAGTITAN